MRPKLMKVGFSRAETNRILAEMQATLDAFAISEAKRSAASLTAEAAHATADMTAAVNAKTARMKADTDAIKAVCDAVDAVKAEAARLDREIARRQGDLAAGELRDDAQVAADAAGQGNLLRTYRQLVATKREQLRALAGLSSLTLRPSSEAAAAGYPYSRPGSPAGTHQRPAGADSRRFEDAQGRAIVEAYYRSRGLLEVGA